MKIEELVEKVRTALQEGPATFDEIMKRASYHSPGGIGAALGFLEQRQEVGFDETWHHALAKVSMHQAIRPTTCAAVTETLSQQGPATFTEIGDRAGIDSHSVLGLALGWLHGEGKIRPENGLNESFGWRLAS